MSYKGEEDSTSWRDSINFPKCVDLGKVIASNAASICSECGAIMPLHSDWCSRNQENMTRHKELR